MTKLDQLISKIKQKHVYIQMHNFPDPDAIASAFGLQELLKYRRIPATICYKGKIERAEFSYKRGEKSGKRTDKRGHYLSHNEVKECNISTQQYHRNQYGEGGGP